MAENYFELVGRVGWLECSCTENGTIITKINLGVKKNRDTYQNFFITFLNKCDSKRPVAEKIADECRKGDYIRVKGSLNVDKFTPKNSDKEVEKISLTGWAYNLVEFDEGRRCFVDV